MEFRTILKVTLFFFLTLVLSGSITQAKLGLVTKNKAFNVKGEKITKIAHRWRSMSSMAELEEDNLIRMSSPDDFQEFLVSTPRNYSAVVLFRDDCQNCESTRRRMSRVANAYRNNYPRNEGSIFFVDVHFKICKSVFKQLGIIHTPTLLIIPHYGHLKDLEEMEPSADPKESEILKWLKNTRGIQIILPKRTSEGYDEDFYLILTMSLVFLAFCISKKDVVWPIVTSTEFIALTITSVVIFLISGYMYNIIRGTGFFAVGRNGELYIVYPARRLQLFGETFIMAFLYAIITLSWIILIDARRGIKGSFFLSTIPAYIRINCAFVFFLVSFLCVQIMVSLKS